MKTQASYLKGKINWIILTLVLTFSVAQAQISGNQIYGNNRYNENNYNQNGLPNNTVVSINDNHFFSFIQEPGLGWNIRNMEDGNKPM